jgi:two-component system sensor histidine kinase SenX3
MPRVLGDEEYLPRILTNLLLNACTLSPGGGEVRVEARRGDGFAEIAVRDSGLGLTREQVARVFERF